MKDYTRQDLDRAFEQQTLALEKARDVVSRFRAGKATPAERRAAMTELEKVDALVLEMRQVIGERNIALARTILGAE